MQFNTTILKKNPSTLHCLLQSFDCGWTASVNVAGHNGMDKICGIYKITSPFFKNTLTT